MLPIRRPARHAVSALFIAALAACGGGGGGGSDGGGAVAARVAITPENAPTVAAQAIAAGQAGFVSEALPLTGVQVEAGAARPLTLATAVRTATRFVRGVRSGPLLTGVAIGPVTVGCTSGGSVRVSGDVADPNGDTLADGDRLDLTFNACVEDGIRLDGRMAFTVTDVNADLTLLGVNATTTNFSATVLGVTERVNGALRILIDETDPLALRMDLSSPRFDFDRIRGGVVRVSRSVIDYDYLGVTDATGELRETLSLLASGTFPRLGTVSFDVATVTPIRTAPGALNAYAGSAVVTGANGGTIRMVVVSTGVRLDVDVNGDGTLERSVVRTWAQIEADIDAE